MRLPIVIVEMLQRKSGNDLCLPSDCEFLSLDIESKIGVHLGATTLKRLLGFAKDERAPTCEYARGNCSVFGISSLGAGPQ